MPLPIEFSNIATSARNPIKASQIGSEFKTKDDSYVTTIYEHHTTITQIYHSGDKDDYYYLADGGNNLIYFTSDISGRKWSANSLAYFGPPVYVRYLARDKDGAFIVASQLAVWKYSWDKGLTLLAGNPGQSGYQDGTGTSALFNMIAGITVNRITNDIYVSELNNRTVRKISNGVVSTVAGVGRATRTISTVSQFFSDPGGLEMADDATNSIVVIDVGNRDVKLIRPPSTGTSMVSSIVGKYTGGFVMEDGSLKTAQFAFDWDVKPAKDPDGNWYVPNRAGIRKIFFNSKTSFADGNVRTIAGTTTVSAVGYLNGNGREALFNSPLSLVVQPVKTSTLGYDLLVADGKYIRRVSPQEPDGEPIRISKHYKSTDFKGKVKPTIYNSKIPSFSSTSKTPIKYSDFYSASDFFINLRITLLKSETFSETKNSYGSVTATGTQNDAQVVFTLTGSEFSYKVRVHKADKTGYSEQTVLNGGSVTLGSLDSDTNYEFLIVESNNKRCYKFYIDVGYDTTPTIVTRAGVILKLNENYLLGYNNADLTTIPVGTTW